MNTMLIMYIQSYGEIRTILISKSHLSDKSISWSIQQRSMKPKRTITDRQMSTGSLRHQLALSPLIVLMIILMILSRMSIYDVFVEMSLLMTHLWVRKYSNID